MMNVPTKGAKLQLMCVFVCCGVSALSRVLHVCCRVMAATSSNHLGVGVGTAPREATCSQAYGGALSIVRTQCNYLGIWL